MTTEADKVRARQAVSNAIADGRLVRLPCEKGCSGASQAHHDDYSQPLKVRWLCAVCHAVEHRRWKHPVTTVCAVCSTVFTPPPTKRGRKKTCSKPCADTLRGITERETKARAIVAANYAERQAARRAA